MSIRSVIYARVSSGEQDAMNQTMVLSHWARHRGCEVIKRTALTEGVHSVKKQGRQA